MSRTHGGPRKGKQFDWRFNPVSGRLRITNEDGKDLEYSVKEIEGVLKSLHFQFGTRPFPLANNVELLAKGKERDGLGSCILKHLPGDIKRAQGASYLGVVLEESGLLTWNGEMKGIEWTISFERIDQPTIADALVKGVARHG